MSVTIRAAGTRDKVTADQAGDDSISGGVGGWEQLARPRRSAALAWVGTPGIQWTLPIVLDGFDTSSSVEPEIRQLKAWGRPGKNDDQPPTLIVDTPVSTAPENSKWVLESIEWGEQARNANGRRIQQYATLTFLEYVPAQVLKGPAAKSRDKRNKGKKDENSKGKK